MAQLQLMETDIDQAPVVVESTNIQSKPLAMLLDTTSHILSLCYYIRLWFDWENKCF